MIDKETLLVRTLETINLILYPKNLLHMLLDVLERR